MGILNTLVFSLLCVSIIGCSDDSSTQKMLDASQEQDSPDDGGSDNSDGGIDVPGTPTVSLSLSYNGENEHFFSASGQSFWSVNSAEADLKFCVVDIFGDLSICDSEGDFTQVPFAGIFDSGAGTYELNYYRLSDLTPSGLLKFYFRNGSGEVSSPYDITLGIVPAVEFSGVVSGGARVNADFSLLAYGLLEDGAQWCAANIAIDSPSKCLNPVNYEDVDVDGTNWSYDGVHRVMSLFLTHADLPQTTYKIGFRSKITGEMSEALIVVIE